MNQLLEEIVELAKEVEQEDKIDISKILIDRDSAYKVIGLGLIEHYESTPDEYKHKMLLATATHLVFENMILHMQKNDELNIAYD